MMRYEEARLVRVPRFLTDSAKMVGNMMDMKKNSAISATTDTPGIAIATIADSATLMTA